MLPPCAATRWKPVTVLSAGTDLSISAERSVIGDTLDFLELSIAAKLDAAESEQAALEDFVGSQGCSSDAGQTTKNEKGPRTPRPRDVRPGIPGTAS
jgi:hypothetical protein